MSRKPVWPTMLRMDSMETCSQPLISVIIPVYNSQDTLRKAADSVLEQTYRNTELILVDDGSTDESPAIIDAYASAHPDRVRVIHKENGGLISAWTAGVRESRASCLAFVDSDDWIDTEMCRTMAAHLVQNGDGNWLPGQIVCCGWYYEYRDKAPVKGTHVLPEGVYEGDRLDHEIKKELLGHEERRITFSRCLKLISRELITDNLSFVDPAIRLGEDANIMIPAMLDASRIVILHDPFYHYMYGESSMAHGYDPGAYEDCTRLRKKLLEVIGEKGFLQEVNVQREFLFLFFEIIKNELRRKGTPGVAQESTERILSLCLSESSSMLVSLYPYRFQRPVNRLLAWICRKPSALRIRSARLIFQLVK